MSRRNVRANESIKLQARFKDDLGNIATATGVVVHIYEPDADTSSSANALVQNAIPTYIGNGVYEYSYTIPPCGPEGAWIDQWEGTLACQTVKAELSFTVITEAEAVTIASQINNNNNVTITLPDTIAATDGTTLEGGYSFDFLTTISPAYTSVRKLRLEAGTLFKNVEDYTLESAILEASLEVDSLIFNSGTPYNSKVFEHAKRQYATCLAAKTILNGGNRQLLRSKTLDDLSVQYDNTAILDMSNDLEKCLEKWQLQVMTGGGARSIAQPKGVVKGEYDPDRPIVSRMWASTEDGTLSRRIPVANDRQQPIGKRRALRTYKNKKWW